MECTEGGRAALLHDMVRCFGEAWARGDVAALEPMLSPSYTHTDVLGRLLDRTAWLDYARGRAGHTAAIDFRDVFTRIIGDVAIITGMNDIRGDGDPQIVVPEDFTIRFTQVWIWRSGRWQREAFQATIAKEARA